MMKKRSSVSQTKANPGTLALRVAWISLAVNILLSAFKLFAGLAAHSGAMVSDGIHSASDVFSTILVIIGIRISRRAADEGHQYGHERFECVVAVALSLLLLETGLLLGCGGLMGILHPVNLVVPGKLALVAAIVSIAVKEWMFWYTRSAALKAGSSALMADAWHHRSDSLSSIGALVGVTFAIGGFPVMDSVASILVCVFVVKAAIDIFRDAVNKMVDHACDKDTLEKMRRVILAQQGVMGLDVLRTRLFGEKIYVDAEISADGGQSLREAHAIAAAVRREIEWQIPKVKHCMVHINPWDGDKS